MLIPGDFPKIRLTAQDKASAEIYLYGAHVASWITPDGRERLFLSQRADFRPGSALRGGIPVVFPQFSDQGTLVKHGFARTATWKWDGTPSAPSGMAAAHFQLHDSEETRRIWDRAFRLDLDVTVGGSQLALTLQVANTGSEPFTFTAALHTYFRVRDIARVMVEGLGGLPYREHGIDYPDSEAQLRINGEIDRIYWNVPGPVILHDVDQTLRITAKGFPDVVVWNPGPEKCATLPDMEPDGYRSMLCIEAVLIGQPAVLAPGAVWSGTQNIDAH